MIVRWPAGLHGPGRTEHALVEGVDLVPTLLECAGIPVPYHIQGRSFHALLQGGLYDERTSALTEMNGWKTLRTDRYRYVIEADGRESLFDLDQDPLAYHDHADDPACAELLAELRQQMLIRLLERERPLPRAWAY
jgi:arylsulfatase A-like enzyme